MSKQPLLGIIVKALSSVSLFRGMPAGILEKMAELAKVTQYKKNAVIFKEGDNGDSIHIVVSGRVKLRKKISDTEETILNIAGTSEMFGDMSLMDGLPRSADAVALEDTVLFYIERPVFLHFLRANPDAALKLLETMSLRVRETNEMLVSVIESYTKSPANSEKTPEKVIESHKMPAKEEKTEEYGGDERAYKVEEKTEDYVENTLKWTYSKKFTCPLCARETPSLVAKTDCVQEESVDTDMCTHYRLVNPTFYFVVVCRHCGFAFPESSMDKIRPAKARLVNQQLPQICSKQDFSGVRTIDDAISAYRLAITCQNLAGAKNAVMGRLYMLMSCLCRHKKMQKEERDCMKTALEYLEKAYNYETSVDARAELNLIYLIGELYGRLGRPGKAVEWFKQVVVHPNRQSNPYIVNMARDRWQDFKLQKMNN